ncbi:hypothetical protein CYJ46_01625 [Corynebacterium coyleae]|uniref:Rib/alpha-like domain-containing protein n=1 Tax=Corynebacterium coyleae TaxID=53374 RepID=UPI000C7774F9|nr:Rib/alpha-like domain-containing protein [Corynebacterium coyleae]PLA39040.1 hypothetical protein CYJ46_01625 [Corynebacterium coyleae]
MKNNKTKNPRSRRVVAGVAIAAAAFTGVGALPIVAPDYVAQSQAATAENEIKVPLSNEVPRVEKTTWQYVSEYGEAITEKTKPEGQVFVVVSGDESDAGKFVVKGLFEGRDDVVLNKRSAALDLDTTGEDLQSEDANNAVPRGETLEFEKLPEDWHKTNDGRNTNGTTYKSVTLMPNGDLVVEMQPGIKRAILPLYLVFSTPGKVPQRDDDGWEVEDDNGEFVMVDGLKQVNPYQVLPYLTSSIPLPEIAIKPLDGEGFEGTGMYAGWIPPIDHYMGSVLEGTKDPRDDLGTVVLTASGQADGAEISYVYDYSTDQLNVPGEGTWRIGDSGFVGKEYGNSIQFYPEEGFTGVPTPPRIGVRDESSYAIVAQFTEDTRKSLPKDVENFFFFSTSTKKETDADKHTPKGENITVELNGDPKAPDGISNKDELPEGTTFEFVEKPDTSTPGDKPTKVKVTYPDESEDIVDIVVTVKDKGDDTGDGDKGDGSGDGDNTPGDNTGDGDKDNGSGDGDKGDGDNTGGNDGNTTPGDGNNTGGNTTPGDGNNTDGNNTGDNTKKPDFSGLPEDDKDKDTSTSPADDANDKDKPSGSKVIDNGNKGGTDGNTNASHGGVKGGFKPVAPANPSRVNQAPTAPSGFAPITGPGVGTVLAGGSGSGAGKGAVVDTGGQVQESFWTKIANIFR